MERFAVELFRQGGRTSIVEHAADQLKSISVVRPVVIGGWVLQPSVPPRGWCDHPVLQAPVFGDRKLPGSPTIVCGNFSRPRSQPPAFLSMTHDETVQTLIDGGESALAGIFSEFAPRLERMVEFRLDFRLRGRVDPSDVLQEAYIEVARRITDYTSAPTVSFFVWVRQIAWQTLVGVHRRHLGQKRNPNVEVHIHQRRFPNATTYSMAGMLLGNLTSPSQAAIREEMLEQLRIALDKIDETDREVLALRHFEQLSNNEVAEVLGLTKTAASNRYVRALKRLGDILKSMPDFKDTLE